MQTLLPDLFTALCMTAVAAFAVTWVMVVMGHPYWRKGLSLAAASALFFALASVCAAMQMQRPEGAWQMLAALAYSSTIAALTLALQSFRHSRQLRRDVATVLLPVAAILLLDAWSVSQHSVWHGALQSAVYAGQMLCLVVLLLRIRSSTPGRGWQWLIAAQSTQFLLYLLPLGAAVQPSIWATEKTMLLWLMELLPMVVLLVSSVGFLMMLRDRETAAELGRAQLDPLTQLPNRAALVQQLRASIENAAQQAQPLAIMVLDIDHFKSVNDSYGHLVGDHVIQRIARTLTQQARGSDFAARYGGEEFVVVLPNTSAREAFHIAERLCQAVRKFPMQLPSGKLLHTTISIGVYAGNPTHGSSWERLVGAADEAMYRAKNNGRDRVFMSTPVKAMQSQAATAEVERC